MGFHSCPRTIIYGLLFSPLCRNEKAFKIQSRLRHVLSSRETKKGSSKTCSELERGRRKTSSYSVVSFLLLRISSLGTSSLSNQAPRRDEHVSEVLISLSPFNLSVFFLKLVIYILGEGEWGVVVNILWQGVGMKMYFLLFFVKPCTQGSCLALCGSVSSDNNHF